MEDAEGGKGLIPKSLVDVTKETGLHPFNKE